MAKYIGVPVDTDPATLAEDSFDYLQTNIPGWQPSEGNLEVWLIEAQAQRASEIRDLASTVPTSVFRYFGATVVGLPPIDFISATADSTWTMIDTAGYTIPAGTTVGLRDDSGNLILFITLDDVAVPAGADVTDTGEVRLVAVEPGTSGNGLDGTLELVDTLAYVESAVIEGSTSGGEDAETDEEYLDRLVTLFQLFAPRPIVARDVATLARSVPGVDRAVAIDGYNPDDSSTNNERMVTVAVIDVDGAAVSSTISDAVQALLETYRETNFIFNVVDPTYTEIDVNVTVAVYPDFDPTDVATNVAATLADYLHPSTWGLPPFGDRREWLDDRTVRYLDLVSAVDRTEGVHYVSSLTFRKGADSFATADILLPGVPALPEPGTFSIGTI